jgi:hypothetical protein
MKEEMPGDADGKRQRRRYTACSGELVEMLETQESRFARRMAPAERGDVNQKRGLNAACREDVPVPRSGRLQARYGTSNASLSG